MNILLKVLTIDIRLLSAVIFPWRFVQHGRGEKETAIPGKKRNKKKRKDDNYILSFSICLLSLMLCYRYNMILYCISWFLRLVQLNKLNRVKLIKVTFISIHFNSLHFNSFHFNSFYFISIHFNSFHFNSFQFILFYFNSFQFILFHFNLFQFISFHFTLSRIKWTRLKLEWCNFI